MGRFLKGLMLAAALALCGPALADDLSPQDAKAIHDYVLSMEKIQAMDAAMSEVRRSPTAWSRLQTPSPSKSLDMLETEVGNDADTMAIFARHNLTATDAIILPLVLMFANMAVLDPKANLPVSPEQVAFYKAHEKELASIHWSAF